MVVQTVHKSTIPVQTRKVFCFLTFLTNIALILKILENVFFFEYFSLLIMFVKKIVFFTFYPVTINFAVK